MDKSEPIHRFNLVSRDCPICYRLGTLIGPLHAGATLQCLGTTRAPGCLRSFVYEPPKTLARLDTSRAVAKRCSCGALIGAGYERCSPCIELEIREHAAATRANRRFA